MKWTPLILAALLVVVQGDLWLGKGNLPYVWGLQKQLEGQRQANAAARERNARVAAEVSDLKEGLEMVEEKARFDLGMVNMMKRLAHEGLVAEPLVVNLFFGNLAGLQATPLEFGLAVERLPEGSIWSGAGLGDFQLTAQLLSLGSGGGARVGLEDSLHLDPSREVLATNVQLVERVHQVLQIVGRDVMTPAHLRAAMGRA
jgi:cell division protein FtsB